MALKLVLNPGPASLVGDHGTYSSDDDARDAAMRLVGLLRLIRNPEAAESADPAWDEPCNAIGSTADHVKLPDGSYVWLERP